MISQSMALALRRIASSRGVRIAMAVPPTRNPNSHSVKDGLRDPGTQFPVAVDCVGNPCRPGASVKTSYKAPPAVWVGCWVALTRGRVRRNPLWRVLGLGFRTSGMQVCDAGRARYFRDLPVRNGPFGYGATVREICPHRAVGQGWCPAFGRWRPVPSPNAIRTAVGTRVVVLAGP